MSDIRENSFQMLDDEDGQESNTSSHSELKISNPSNTSLIGTNGLNASNGLGDNKATAAIDNQVWTDVTTKVSSRRLAPQVTLTKQDLGSDSPRNRAAQEMAMTKKKGKYT